MARAITGNLTAAGTTQPVTLNVDDVTVDPGRRLRVRASARIDRYSFDVTRAKGMAARHLDITLDVALHRSPEVPGER